ncbi:MAG: sulfatase [Planctomycetota bacterium]
MTHAASIALSFALTAFVTSGADADSQPNILFILTDDQGWSSLGCYGGKDVRTPSIDRLAETGIRFRDAYVTPQCTPTRASLLTGQHTARNGMWHVIPWYGAPYAAVEEPLFREELLPEQCRLPHGLRSAGYVTGMSGKWHLTSNRHQGYYSFLEKRAGPDFGFDHVGEPGAGSQNEGDKWVNHLTDDAIQFIQTHRGRPWFYYLSHHTLHGVVTAPEALIQKYRDRGAPNEGLGNATYLAAVEHLDTSVGRLMDALDETGQRDNTLIVFLADNGGVDTRYHNKRPDGSPLDIDEPLVMRDQQLENAPLREGKGSMYEGGIRVPCIVNWPNAIQGGRVCTQPIHVVDWLPTLLDAAGTHAEQLLDGVSLLPLFHSERLPSRELYWYMPLYDLLWAATPCAVIRDGDWKLIEFFGDWYDEDKQYHSGAHVELYNLRTDLSETVNLADARPERVTQLRSKLHAWIEETGATIPGANPHFERTRSTLTTRDKPSHLQAKIYRRNE